MYLKNFVSGSIVLLAVMVGGIHAAEAVQTISVSTSVSGTGGTISPASKNVKSGTAATFTVKPFFGYSSSVSGCGGTLQSTTYKTGIISSPCTVAATFTARPMNLAITSSPMDPNKPLSYKDQTGVINFTVSGVANSQDLANSIAVKNTWVIIDSVTYNGKGAGQVKFHLGANSISQTRVGTLALSGHAYAIWQSGKPCTLTISSASNTPIDAAGGYVGVNVGIDPVIDGKWSVIGAKWTPATSSDWLQGLFLNYDYVGSGVLHFTADQNDTGKPRSVMLTFQTNDLKSKKTVTVKQAAGAPTTITSPTNLSPVASGNKIILSWQPVNRATSYNIYWSTSPGVNKSNSTRITNVSSPYIHTPVTNGTTYYYAVTALKDNAESDIASEQSITSSRVTQLAANYKAIAALKSDGSVWAWGTGYTLGYGGAQVDFGKTPTKVPGLSSVIKIAAGQGYFLALKSDGTLWAWGNNDFGALGDGTNTNKANPVQVLISDVVDIGTTNDDSFALKRDGTLWAWGSNIGDLLGAGVDSSNDYKSSPIIAPGISNVVSLQTVSSNCFATKSDGSFWQLGVGAPSLKPGITNAKLIGGMTGAIYATNQDGTIWGWGSVYQSLTPGDNGIVSVSSATPIQLNLSVISSISVDTNNYTAIVKNDGSVWVVHFDPNLGVWKYVYEQATLFSNAISTTAGLQFTYILLGDGTISCIQDEFGVTTNGEMFISPSIPLPFSSI